MKYILTETQLKKIIKDVIKEAEFSDDLLGGQPLDLTLGPNTHPSNSDNARKWVNKNAYDLKAPSQTPVYSLCSGRIAAMKKASSTLKKGQGTRLYGNQIRIECNDGRGQFFYTHLSDVGLSQGSQVECGQLLGNIVEVKGGGIPPHVHTATEKGDLLDYVDKNGKLKCRKETKFTNNFKIKPIDLRARVDNTAVKHYYPKL